MITRQLASPMGDDLRVHIWRAALAQHAESPWIGVGARMFYAGGVTHRDPASSPQAGDSLFAHNEYLQTLADYGWIGLALVLLLVVAHLLNGLRFLRWFVAEKFLATGHLSSNTLALTLGGMAALVATLVHAVFEFHGHVPITAVCGAVVLGLLANPGIESDVFKSRRVWGVRLLMKIVMLAASVAMIGGAAIFGVPDAHAAIAQVQNKRGEIALALKNLARATDLDPRNAALAYQHGLVLIDSYQPGLPVEKRRAAIDQMVIELKRACLLNPFSHLYWLALADALDAAGKRDEAMAAIHRALVLAPLYEEPRLALGFHHHRMGQFEEAEFAYLWAGQAKALNSEGMTNWLESYRQLLGHTAVLAERERAALNKP
jgi:tetratricopeptide (TPR) repeat protein